jgi:hypothetical protein
MTELGGDDENVSYLTKRYGSLAISKLGRQIMLGPLDV